jgi:type VI secretion system secreted protein Hcp
MSSKFLMNMVLKNQGTIKGSSTRKGGAPDYGMGIECHGFNYDVLAPRDAAGGLPTGKRTHKPITIVREVDSASPLLWQAVSTGDPFVKATLSFPRPTTNGKPTVAHTIELTNGTISKVNQYNPGGVGDGKKWEKLTLIYEGMTVDGLKDGIIPRSIVR